MGEQSRWEVVDESRLERRRAVRDVKQITPKELHAAPTGKDLYDGDGLVIRVRNEKAYGVFRYTSPVSGKRREKGLRELGRTSLKETTQSLERARNDADAARIQLRNRVDPLDAEAEQARLRRVAEAARKADAERERRTLVAVARQYHEAVVEKKRTSKHAAQWISSIASNLSDKLKNAAIDQVDHAILLDELLKIHARIPETADRIRQRLDKVFNWAIVRKWTTNNPAAVIRSDYNDEREEVSSESFSSLDYRDVPAFVAALREQPGTAALALEFLIYTASRTQEVLGARWAEIDAAAGLWRIPGVRMKSGKKATKPSRRAVKSRQRAAKTEKTDHDHLVYLVPRALEILKLMRGVDREFVFPSPTKPNQQLSNMSMLTLLRRMKYDDRTTVHGFRSSFSTAANELAWAREDVVEAALAHREADRVRRAYNKAQFLEERWRLALIWAEFIEGQVPASNVLPIRAA